MNVHDKTRCLDGRDAGASAPPRAMRRAPCAKPIDATKNKALRAAAQRHPRAQGGNPGRQCAKTWTRPRRAAWPPRCWTGWRSNDTRIEAMAKGVEDVAALPDPVGRELARWTRPNGLDIARVATPIGVIGIIYESRPNVTADAGALALKSGNVAILRGGSESAAFRRRHSCRDGRRACRRRDCPKPRSNLCRNTDRAAVGLMLEGLNGAIDLIIPRGGKGLTGRVMREARVPVLAHLEGICHVYVHEKADLGHGARDRAERQDAAHPRLRRGGDLADRPRHSEHRMALPILDDLAKAGCEIRGDEAVRGDLSRRQAGHAKKTGAPNISTPSSR